MGNEFRAVVHPYMDGGWIQLEQLLNRVDHLSSPAAPADSNRQAEPAVLVDHVQELEGSPIHRLIELKINGPDVVGILGPQQFPFATGRP
jgi:hypothetical protein